MTRTPVEEHLRRLLEIQPGCVVRITVDGIFLAVNAAALALLGGERLDQVLDTSLLDLVAPDQRDQCGDFLARLGAGERRSAEFDLTGADGVRRPVQFHAVPIPDPHDGIPSALCACQLLSDQRRLEQAVLEAAASADEQALARAEESARFSGVLELERRKASVAQAEREQRISELELQLATMAAREQAASTASEEYRRQIAGVQLEATRLEAALKDAEAETRQKVATHEAERAELERALAALEGEKQAAARDAARALVEREALELQVRRCDRLAQAGRLGISLAAELEDCLRKLSDSARSLLDSMDSSDERRPLLNRIACAALDGAALADQITAAGRTEAAE